MNYRRIKEIIVGVLGICALFLWNPMQSNAEEFSFLNGENTEQITNKHQVTVKNNETFSEITISEDGHVVFAKELTAVRVDLVENVKADQEDLAVIIYRYSGTSNALFFEVVNLKDGESIYISKVYPRARFQVEDDEIIVEYPEYEADDVMTDPARMVKKSFLLKKDLVIEETREVEEIVKKAPKANLSGVNPLPKEISELLTEEALNAGVPPEIVKGIAQKESEWDHYFRGTLPDYLYNCEIFDGSNVKIGSDCYGIGIMQVSDYRHMDEGPEKEEYIRRLKEDVRFNIQEGIKILKDKWNWGGNLIPTVNDNNPKVMEDWYFAVMAYNGLAPINNPVENAFNAYQEQVFALIAQNSFLDLTPMPTYKLKPYKVGNQIRFENENVIVEGPENFSSHMLEAGDIAYIVSSVNFRETPEGEVIGNLPKGTKVTIDLVGDKDKFTYYAWIPIKTSSGETGYVATSYLRLSDYDYLDVYPLYGKLRYDTAVSVSNHGWHWEQPDSVIIAQGILPVDALTGSVLAASLDAPILLNQSDRLTESTEKELSRLKPDTVYILGGENAISKEVFAKLDSQFDTVIRISGKDRYLTAKEVADRVMNYSTTNDIIVTTGNETSSDPLAIAPYAGKKEIPILLTSSSKLSQPVKAFIQENNINKVTIIGGTVAISNNVANELNKLVGASNVERVYGQTRFETNIEIVKKYYKETTSNNNLIDFNDLIVAQGMNTADALAAAPFATKIDAPIILTYPNKVPTETREYLENEVLLKPDLYFLGGQVAIQDGVREQIKLLVK